MFFSSVFYSADSFKINGKLHCPFPAPPLFFSPVHPSLFSLPHPLLLPLSHMLFSSTLIAPSFPHSSLFFLSFLPLCNPNVLYVVIKQCQTQKLFINNIKQKVSSNGWCGLFFVHLLLEVHMHICVRMRAWMCLIDTPSKRALRLNDKAMKRKEK